MSKAREINAISSTSTRRGPRSISETKVGLLPSCSAAPVWVRLARRRAALGFDPHGSSFAAVLLPVCRSWPCAVTSGCNRSPGSAAGFIARSGYSRGGGAFQIAMDLHERAEEIDRENPVPTPTEPRSRLKRSSGGGSGVCCGESGRVLAGYERTLH